MRTGDQDVFRGMGENLFYEHIFAAEIDDICIAWGLYGLGRRTLIDKPAHEVLGNSEATFTIKGASFTAAKADAGLVVLVKIAAHRVH